MSRLNKAQIYAIRWLASENKGSADIASELSITEDQVIKTMEKYSKTQEDKNAIKTKKSSVASKSKELMIRHTSSKKNNNVSIMTKEASQLNDDIKKKMKFNENTEKGIFRPKSNGN
jgi:hypothetical protein